MRNLIAVLLGALATAGAGCGSKTECGAGTTEVNGTCVPSEDACGAGAMLDPVTGTCVGTTCAVGTTLVDGECVPDGTVICEQGTVFDSATGTCVVDASACAAGTVLVDGECVPFDDTLIGDVAEGAEPNDLDHAPVNIELPATDATLTLSGCFSPVDLDGDGDLDADSDGFAFVTTGPMLLEVTIDGKGGASAGFVLAGGSAAMDADGWIRLGADLTADGASRQVFLPDAGLYGLAAVDARSLLLGLPAGDPGPDAKTCWFMQITPRDMPAPTPLVAGAVSGTHGDPQFFSMTATDKQLVFTELRTEVTSAARGAFVQMVDGAYRGSAIADETDGIASDVLAGLGAGQTVVVVVEPMFDISLDDVDFDFEVSDAGAVPAPLDGPVTLTHTEETYAFLHFDGVAGDVVRLEFDGGVNTFQVAVVSTSFTAFVSTACSSCSAADVWLQLGGTGTYYIRLYNNDGNDGAAYTVNLTRTHRTPAPLTSVMPAPVSLATDDRAFFVVDAASADWLRYSAASPVNLTDVEFRMYSRSQEGQLDAIVPAIDSAVYDTTGDQAIGRVYAGGAGELMLVSVADDAGHDGDETFDVVLSDVPVNILGTISEAMPLTATDTPIGSVGVRYFIVTGAPATEVTALVTGKSGLDPTVSQLARDESVEQAVNANAGADTTETLSDKLGQGDDAILILAVSSAGGTVGFFDLALTAVDPPYLVTAGTTSFVDVCPGSGGAGVDHVLVEDSTGFGAGDEGISAAPVALPFAFDLFGTAATELTVASNGWLTLATGFTGDAGFGLPAIPNTDNPNSVVAPNGDDLDGVTVCVLVEADAVTVQWQGHVYGFFSPGPNVSFQAVLNADGSMTFAYGSGHAATGSTATLGLENAAGDEGVVIGNSEAGTTTPGVSHEIVPN
jgi:hypothetical protein